MIDLEQIEREHRAWLVKDLVSAGQREDSQTVLLLVDMIKQLQSCPNESWECDKEIRALKRECDRLRAECASMGRLLQSGILVPNEEYSKLRRVIDACRKNTHKSQEIADAIREYGEIVSIREEMKK